jgi:hypothetical protein
MKDLRLSRRQVLKGAGAVGVLGALGIPTTVFADGTRVRWDIISIDRSNFPNHVTVSAGGILHPAAEDGSKITLTGSGTFRPGEDGGVTGGGTWATSDPKGVQTGGGTYKVTGLVSFVVAPGSTPSTFFIDTIGNHADESAGLAVLQIRYSDGSRGVLTVSCMLTRTLTPAVFEGVTATKGYIDYWNREHSEEAPPAPATATLFHIMSEDSKD